ncbi:MAG: hypothetical protein ACYDDO_05270 [Acidiferrobacterales bacterium]
MKIIVRKLFSDQNATIKQVNVGQLIFHRLSMCFFDSANSIYASRMNRLRSARATAGSRDIIGD